MPASQTGTQSVMATCFEPSDFCAGNASKKLEKFLHLDLLDLLLAWRY